jgi:hypothetical protein
MCRGSRAQLLEEARLENAHWSLPSSLHLHKRLTHPAVEN